MDKFFGSIALLIMIAAVYCTFSNAAPALVINQWQIKIMADNKCFPALTILLLALPPLLVLFVIKSIVLKSLKK